MGRDGFLVPLEMKKKTGVSTSWILLDHNGQETILDVDKYAVMRRVHIHARDLRILDPLLSYPSTILGREKVIVLNLEVRLAFMATTFSCFRMVVGWAGFGIVEQWAGMVVACMRAGGWKQRRRGREGM
nr:magnesium transporter MRS2-I-like [Ziziphus jujuba var. spinosa]